MSARLAVVRRVAAVRKRVRDAAAGAAQAAEQWRVSAVEDAAAAQSALTAVLDGGLARLDGGDGVRALLRLDDERALGAALVAEAAVATAAATAESERRRAVVRERERELRTSERLVTRLRELRETGRRRDEQRLVDDASARVARGER